MHRITRREHEVIYLYCGEEELEKRQIAEKLGISIHTVVSLMVKARRRVDARTMRRLCALYGREQGMK